MVIFFKLKSCQSIRRGDIAGEINREKIWGRKEENRGKIGGKVGKSVREKV